MSKPFMNILIAGSAIIRGKSPTKAIQKIKTQEIAAKHALKKSLGTLAKDLLSDEANFRSIDLGFSNYKPSNLTKIKWFLRKKFQSIK